MTAVARDELGGLPFAVMSSPVMVVVRVTPGVHWHALEDDVVVGRGHALHRADGRVFVSVDTWRDDVFDSLAEAIEHDLPGRLYTLVDDDDGEVLARWSSRGFVEHRRELEYVIPVAAEITGLNPAQTPPDTLILAAGQIDPARLRELDRRLRAEINGSHSWGSMPPHFRRPPSDRARVDTSPYTVAVHEGEYSGLLRIWPLPRRPRLGLIAVTSAHRRRGLGRALLADAFERLQAQGISDVSAEVDATDEPARSLFTGLGAARSKGAVELLRQ